MAKKTKEPKIKLRHPDRSPSSAPAPEDTLLGLASKESLFARADRRQQELDDAARLGAASLSPGAERFLEACLWTFSLATLHLSFDVLVQHQYGTEIRWDHVVFRTGVAWLVFLMLFWPLHPHHASPRLVPGLPDRYQEPLRQALFFAMSAASGCHLIHITNRYGYLKVMKRAPPLGCLWLWAVVELDLPWAVLSLAVAGGFLWYNGYDIK